MGSSQKISQCLKRDFSKAQFYVVKSTDTHLASDPCAIEMASMASASRVAFPDIGCNCRPPERSLRTCLACLVSQITCFCKTVPVQRSMAEVEFVVQSR